jgi:transposase
MNMRFKAVDRETPYLLAPSIQDWLPEQHLARFIVEVISKLDLHELKMPYTGVGSEAFNPEMLLALLVYGYATGVFASRKLEQATHDSVAFRYIAANTHKMKHRLATPEGRAIYGQRKSTVEPVIGIVKSVLGFRQFHFFAF